MDFKTVDKPPSGAPAWSQAAVFPIHVLKFAPKFGFFPSEKVPLPCVFLDPVIAIVGLDPEKSFVLRDTLKTPGQQALLEHEQGHFDIIGLIFREMVEQLLDLRIDDVRFHTTDEAAINEAKEEIRQQGDAIARRGHALLEHIDIGEGLYEKDTDHGMDKDGQSSWNKVIAATKAAPKASFERNLIKGGLVSIVPDSDPPIFR